MKQPEAGYLFSWAALIPSYSAIMRGAVLYKLGVDVVRERVMRMSYGIETKSHFRAGYHPGSRWYMNINGLPYCRGVMEWFALKVCFRLIPCLTLRGKDWQPEASSNTVSSCITCPRLILHLVLSHGLAHFWFATTQLLPNMKTNKVASFLPFSDLRYPQTLYDRS